MRNCASASRAWRVPGSENTARPPGIRIRCISRRTVARRGQVVQGVHAQHAVEALAGEGQQLSARSDEERLIAKHQAIVSREPATTSAHHLDREIDRDRSDAEPRAAPTPSTSRPRHRARDRRAWRKQLARNREVEEVVPALGRARPVQREVQAGREVLFLVGFGGVGRAPGGRRRGSPTRSAAPR